MASVSHPPQVGRPAGRWRGRLAAIGLGLGFCAAASGAMLDASLPEPGPASATAASRSTASVKHDAASARLLELERAGRAQPLRLAAQLADMIAADQFDPDNALDALAMQGSQLASVSRAADAEAVAAALDARYSAGANPLARAYALSVRARIASQSGDYARGGELIDAALAQLPSDAGKLTRLRLLLMQAYIRQNLSRLEDAIRIGHEALRLADACCEAWRRAETRSALSNSYFAAKQYARALDLGREALATAKADGDPLAIARVSTTQAIVLEALGDVEGEKRLMQMALANAHKAGAKYEESLYLANLADVYLKSGEYATVIELAQRALPLARELKNPEAEWVALANIGLARIRLGQVDAGKQSLRLAIDLLERRGSLADMAMIHREMAQALEGAGDLRGAIESFHRQRTFEDQALVRSQQKAILAMQETFDNDRRTSELELLRRQGAIQGQQLQTRTLQQRLWALVAACGLLALGMAALLMRRVRDTNRRLADSNAQLEAHAGVDPLTGLSNRRRFQSEMRRLSAEGAFSGTVFLADIDHFKRVNDCFGHASGDAVLVEIARRLRSVLREPDLIVRWGGEEFLVVVRAASPEAVEALARRMLEVVGAKPVVHERRVIGVTASIGYATFPIEPTLLAVSWERAINLVDTALYLAKAHGRNRAYGVRMINANDVERFDSIARSLESAWQSCDVALTLLEGPGRGEAVADDAMPRAA